MKKYTNLTIGDPQLLRDLASDPSVLSMELFPAPANGHKFAPGDTCILHGLESFPEFNGQQVTITSIREDGVKGRAYYIEGAINEFLNWVYEYRLK